MIPGFLGTIEEVSPLRNFLINEGFFVYTAVLTGHGTDDLIPSYEKWLQEVEIQFLRFLDRYNNVVIIGFSLGGLLTSYLFKIKTYKISSVILISPSFLHVYFHNIKYSAKVFNELKEHIKKTGFRKKISIARHKNLIYGVKELRKLSNRAQEEEWLKEINRPSLIIQGLNDGLIKKDNPMYVYNNISSKDKKIMIVKGNHNLSKLVDEKILEEIKRFILKY